MSADKRRAWQRGITILRRAAEHPAGILTFNCLGGMSAANPDVQSLVRDGFLEPLGRPSPPKWSKEWHHLFRVRDHLHGHAFRTMSRITAKGRDAILADHRGNRVLTAATAARVLSHAHRVRKLQRKHGW